MFNFPFQTLYDHQKLLEEKQQTNFSEIQRRLEKESLVLERYKNERERNVKELQSQIQEGMQIEKIELYRRFIHQTAHLVDQQRKKLLLVEEELERAKKALLQASTRRKALEKLREKAWLKFTQVTNKLEREFMDETSIRRYMIASPGIDKKAHADLNIPDNNSKKDLLD
ncbi:MAG: flagellar export protein FliJ [Deltaproteobacteria bacterium]|nr:flagellar export protein FliJ [Deltaproteobacteria bacterium]